MKNSYTMKNAICCFIDILGYKNICSSTDEKHEENIYNLSQIINDFVGRMNGTLPEPLIKIEGLDIKNENVKIKTFSDSIYIEILIENDLLELEKLEKEFDNKLLMHTGVQVGAELESKFGNIVSSLIEFQRDMIFKFGFLIRGGIVYDKVYSDDNIIYGNGIVNATNLEKQTKFPRIAICKELKETLDKRIRYFYGDEYWGDKEIIKLEGDSEYFLNYLEDRDFFCEELIIQHKELIEKNIGIFQENLKKVSKESNDYVKIQDILQKYEWLKKYHNFYVEKCEVSDENYEDDFRNFKRYDLLVE